MRDLVALGELVGVTVTWGHLGDDVLALLPVLGVFCRANDG